MEYKDKEGMKPRHEMTLEEAGQLPLTDWQVAGLAFLLYKGGLNWLDTGTFEIEGRANIETYRQACDQAGKPILKLYIESIGGALELDAQTQDKPLQKQVRATQIALRELVHSLDALRRWTYCGVLTPGVLMRVDQVDHP